MTFRIAQISDTHLSGEKPFFVANFQCVVRSVAAARPDLVVNTGDISLDGVGHEGDLIEARRLHEAIDRPVRFIPGNHDIGDSADVPNSREHPIDTASRERYRRHFGSEWWHVDVPGWRIVAVNAQLCGSNLEAEDEQATFIAEIAGSAGPSRIALFIHKPIFDQSESEAAIGGRFVNPAARARLLTAFGAHRPVLIASGHVHQFRRKDVQGARHVWAPSTGFFIPDARQPRYGLKEVGYVIHELYEDGRHESRFEKAAGSADLNIADFPNAYGEH